MKWPLWTSGIRSRLLLISILPVVVATVLLSWFSLVSQNESLSRAFFQSGDSVTAYIAATAELGMYAADRTALKRLGASALKTPDVVGIGFIDSGINLLAASGDTSVIGREGIELCLENGRWEEGLYLFFCKPVLESEQLVSDFDLDVKQVRAGPNQYGWVMLAVSRESMALQQQANAQVLLGVALIVVLAAALLAFRISGSISMPVLSLEKTVNELDSGRLSSRAEVAGPSETRALARGINRLARSVAQSQEQLATKVENSTRRVVTAMDALSKKNRALEKTQQALKLASTAKDDFLAKMSHELRTPLTTVVGFSRLLNQSKMNSKQVEYSDNITVAAELLLDTINNMLDFSKLQSSAVSIENIKFDLREAMEGLVAMHAYQAESTGLDLILIIDRNIPRLLLGDPTRIKQIVNNLLSNAVKFTKQGEVVLRVSLMKGENDDGSLSIEVIDSGIGMDEKSQARLFQPFTQADDTITRRFGGTGLGLVICKQLAELMGGDIVINSDLGVGTCMTVTLPLLATDLSFVMPVRPPSDFNVLVYDTSPWGRQSLQNHFFEAGLVAAVGSKVELSLSLEQTSHAVDILVLSVKSSDVKMQDLADWLLEIRAIYQGSIIFSSEQRLLHSPEFERILQNYMPIFCVSRPVKHSVIASIVQGIDSKTETVNSKHREAAKLPLKGLKDLLAEDNFYNRKLIETIVVRSGAAVSGVENGGQAVDLFEREHFDAVLMDIHMPIMDGISATQKIVALADDGGIPVFGLTANVIERDHDRMLKAGANYIFGKPLDEVGLIKAICECTGRSYHPQWEQRKKLVESLVSPQSLQIKLNMLFDKVSNEVRQLNIDQANETLHEMRGLSGMFGMILLSQQIADLARVLTAGGKEEKLSNLFAEIKIGISELC